MFRHPMEEGFPCWWKKSESLLHKKGCGKGEGTVGRENQGIKETNVDRALEIE